LKKVFLYIIFIAIITSFVPSKSQNNLTVQNRSKGKEYRKSNVVNSESNSINGLRFQNSIKNMYTLCITVNLKPGNAAKFSAISSPVVEASRKEEGCLWFDLLQAKDNPDIWLFYEAYKSKEDFDKHLKLPHTKIWLEQALTLINEKGFELSSFHQVYSK
jgi:quinol monooxygenase YgiN